VGRGLHLATPSLQHSSSSHTRAHKLTTLHAPATYRQQLISWATCHQGLNLAVTFSCHLCFRGDRLKLLVTSATLDGEKFSTYFNNCPVSASRVPHGSMSLFPSHSSLADHSG
jgi:hypothetical protein